MINNVKTCPTFVHLADFLASFMTAYMFIGRQTSPTASDGPVRGTVGMAAGYQPLSNCARSLIGFQIFMWNVACVGSFVVLVVFWGLLVRRLAFGAARFLGYVWDFVSGVYTDTPR